jgi:(1->4)-alpha-D-glucan 1-alpha-D-glucosylmutase
VSDALVRLAELHGIAQDYRDTQGRTQVASPITLRALLATMGIAAATEAEVEHALAAHAVERWRQAAPPVVVARQGTHPTMRINFALSTDIATLSWRLTEEGGAAHAGLLAPGLLPDAMRMEVDGKTMTARQFELPLKPPLGYHRLAIAAGESVLAEILVIVTPARCYSPPSLDNSGRQWGFTLQLYALRSERNWGIGDFTDLAVTCEHSAAAGASFVGVNPLHALFPGNPAHASPYSPSSRLFLNILYLDVEAIFEFSECEEALALVRSQDFQSSLQRLRGLELVDYVGVAELKRRVLALVYAHFRDRHLGPGSARSNAFNAFCSEGGEALRCYALFEALQEHFASAGFTIAGWQAWPEGFRDPSSPQVQHFAVEHAERVDYFRYLQWQAELQLGTVVRRSREAGLNLGLYADLAVSVDRAGAEVWTNQRLYAATANVGAPPDDFNLSGQDWGLPPPLPNRLEEAGYAPFVATLRANMRHASALRIDHVMGLMRLFWVPVGGKASEGAYVHYPFADLLGILALESHRRRCLVIGEDLGTVPEALHGALADAGVLSYRVLLFEQESGAFKPPATYPARAIVTVSTHDLPTLAGWWSGRDLALRAELGLFPNEALHEQQLVDRALDRARLLLAVDHERLLPLGVSADPSLLPSMTAEVACAVQAFLARTPAELLAVQLEDALGVGDQVNLPASADMHPNWRRKLPRATERFDRDERLIELGRMLRRLRPSRLAPGQQDAGSVGAHVPRASYRLQLHRDFTFADATALIPYLATLGISHIYCSPYLRARAGSRHGYDIVAHGELNPEIGERADFVRFVEELAEHGMGQIVDVVPNHMGAGSDNAWWLDVLENGPASPYADYFDIDWHPINVDLAGKVLVPVLDDHYGKVLERGDLKLAFDAASGAFGVHFHQNYLPVDPREYPTLLERAKNACGDALPPVTAAEWDSLVAAFHHLPARDGASAEQVAERHRDKQLHKARLAELVSGAPLLGEAIADTVRQLNGVPGEPDSFAALHELLEAQAYRVAYWRVAAHDINYRRFLDINDLAALRVENEAVFDATHHRILELAAEGKVQGLRIDHPDGLYDPAEYFQRLQDGYARLNGGSDSADRRPLYVVLEKIDAPHEQLPIEWPVHGTTGYRFANLLNGVFIETAAKARIDRTWRAFVGEEAMPFDEVAYLARHRIMSGPLAAELTVLANRLLRVARSDLHTRDLTLASLWQALAEIAACFPVYRTYVAQRVSAQDRRFIDWAVARARRRSRSADGSVFDFVRDVLLLQPPPGASAALQDTYRMFAMRFQQYTAPIMVKGVEDTAFYLFNRLVSQNEVGGDPATFGTTPRAFHRGNAERRKRWPDTLLALSTHDNKRSADVRARIDVISERPAAWRLLVKRWSRMNRRHGRTVDGRLAPSRNDEYLLYQTLIGTLPATVIDAAALEDYRTRIEQYMVKAAREAKLHTSWINVDEEYESALKAFIAALLEDTPTNAFLDDLRSAAPAFAWFGALNSTAMALVHCTAPGVPDIYQGCELVDLSLVDPDNRRAVDYALRREALRELEALAATKGEAHSAGLQSLLAGPHDGRLKLWVMWRALGLRRANHELFARGNYVPVAVTGMHARHVLAYARRLGEDGLIAVSGRFFASLGTEAGVAPVGGDVWSDTALELPFVTPGTRLTDELTGEVKEATTTGLGLAAAFARLPFALFSYGPEPSAGIRQAARAS